MQLPPDDELVLVSGCHPIRAKKARYFEDPQLKARILPPPQLAPLVIGANCDRPAASYHDDWEGAVAASTDVATEDPANSGIRREPELPEQEEIVPEPRRPLHEFDALEDEPDDDARRQQVMRQGFGNAIRQAPLDRADDLGM